MPVFSLIFAEILNVFYKTGDELRRESDFWALMFLIIAIISFFSNFGQVAAFTTSGEKLTRKLREMTFVAFLRQEIGYFDRPEHSSGVLASKLADDAGKVQGITGQLLGSVVQSIAAMITGVAIAFAYGWELTLVALTIVPLIAFGGYLQLKALQGFGAESKKAYEAASQVASETIQNIRTVAMLTKEEFFYDKFCENIVAPHKTTVRSALISSIGFGFSQGIEFFSYCSMSCRDQFINLHSSNVLLRIKVDSRRKVFPSRYPHCHVCRHLHGHVRGQ